MFFNILCVYKFCFNYYTQLIDCYKKVAVGCNVCMVFTFMILDALQ